MSTSFDSSSNDDAARDQLRKEWDKNRRYEEYTNATSEFIRERLPVPPNRRQTKEKAEEPNDRDDEEDVA